MIRISFGAMNKELVSRKRMVELLMFMISVMTLANNIALLKAQNENK
jgi:hypothetical protein